jgi:hypothetical protein
MVQADVLDQPRIITREDGHPSDILPERFAFPLQIVLVRSTVSFVSVRDS